MVADLHPYDALVQHLRDALAELRRLGLGDSLAKGRVGEVLLAHHLGHSLKLGDKGADGIGPDGSRFEYKVSHDDQFNFNFGHARPEGEIETLVTRHFDGIAGSYCALMDGPQITKVVFCGAETLVPYLKNHLRNVTGMTYSKNFSPIERFAQLPNAKWVLGGPLPGLAGR